MFNKLSPPIISVIVCTYNRVSLLDGALESVCAQTINSALFEIIVVDNKSTDSTKSLVEHYCANHQNIRYVLEENQGLSYARNRGLLESRGQYVAYIDDDCKVPSKWLSIANAIIENVTPTVFGGPFFAFYNTPKPIWFRDAYGSHNPFPEAKKLIGNECEKIFGGNMFFQRSLLLKVGGFDTDLGMTGKKIAYGEETALIIKIAEEVPGQIFYFDPALYVYHLVRPEKMKMVRIMRECFALGRYAFRLTHSDEGIDSSRMQILKMALSTFKRLIVDMIRGLQKRDRSKYQYVQNYLYERTFYKHLRELGSVYEMYRQRQ